MPATFHVALTGSDITGDGSIATPFRTIQKGIATAAATADGDDIVAVAGGTYALAGVDLNIPILASANLTNLQLQGGWDATFAVQNPAATPTIYVFQNAPGLSGDMGILDPNTTVSGFTWVFDGQAVRGPRRTDSIGFVVQTTGAVITNNQFEVSPRTTGGRPTAIQTASTDLTGLQITDNAFTFDAITPNSTSAAVGIFINPDTGGRITPLVIDGNSFTGDNLGSAIVISTTSNVEFTNNSVTRTGSSNTGLSLVDLRQTTADQTGILIHSNDLVNQSANAIGAGILTNGSNFGIPTNTLSATLPTTTSRATSLPLPSIPWQVPMLSPSSTRSPAMVLACSSWAPPWWISRTTGGTTLPVRPSHRTLTAAGSPSPARGRPASTIPHGCSTSPTRTRSNPACSCCWAPVP